MKIFHKYYPVIVFMTMLSIIIFTNNFVTNIGYTSQIVCNNQIIFLASDIAIPSRPTPPTLPSVSKVKEEPQPNKNDESPQTPVVKTDSKNKSENLPTAEKKATQPAPKLNTNGVATPQTENNTVNKSKQPTPEEILKQTVEPQDNETLPQKENKKTDSEIFTPFVKNAFYFIIIIILLCLTAYLYFTTPKDTVISSPQTKRTKTNVPDFKPINKEPLKPLKPLLPINNKITNTSLLEQLIKYDMETYGELRSNLDYEQPAYVECLIRKYGNGDQGKINRAINLFYISRNNK